MIKENLNALLAEAEVFNKTGKYLDAELRAIEILEILDSAIDSIKNETFRELETFRCSALIELSISKWKRGDFQKALTFGLNSLELAEEKNLSNEKKAKALGNIGIAYKELSDYTEALNYNQKALALNEELGNKIGIATNLLNIGNVYDNLLDDQLALKHYKKALAIYEEIGNKGGIASSLGNIGIIYNHFSDFAQAINYHQNSLIINTEIGNKGGIAINLGNIANVYIYLSDYPQALNYLQKAIAIHEEIGNKLGIALGLGKIGVLYTKNAFEKYNIEKATEYILKTIAILEDIGEKKNLYEYYHVLAELYETQEKWKEFAIIYKKYHCLKEEVQSEDAKKQAGIMEQHRQAAEREKEIEIAKAAAAAKLNATTSLLHRVLPESIANRMIDGEENISDFFPSVSILFADIQGFTAISANMKAIDVVRFLNFVFGEFDRIIKLHGCEKIKTIGDGYMAVAGAPIECEDHAELLANAALEMQGTIYLPEDIRQTMPAGARFGIRIGLHTGPVVAGVIGEERFVYDIHSDAVNLASRMESSGEVDRVHVSADFANHLQDRFKKTKNNHHGIRFEDRGEIEIKGKGKMKTYFLN